MANETTSDVLTDERIEALKTIATSTLAHQLQMRGIRSTFFSGLKALHPELRMVGRARTLRYVALREDLQQQYGGGVNAQRRAVESLKPGDVLVIEARGVSGRRDDRRHLLDARIQAGRNRHRHRRRAARYAGDRRAAQARLSLRVARRDARPAAHAVLGRRAGHVCRRVRRAG